MTKVVGWIVIDDKGCPIQDAYGNAVLFPTEERANLYISKINGSNRKVYPIVREHR